MFVTSTSKALAPGIQAVILRQFDLRLKPEPESFFAKDRRTHGLAYSAWIFARCTMSRMRFNPSCVHCVTIAGGEPIGSSP